MRLHQILDILHRVLWAFKYRFAPSQRHHVVRTGLPPGYYDPRDLMLHSSFAMLCRFYEKQAHPGAHTDWQADPEHRQVFDQMHDLYDWWTRRRPQAYALLEIEDRDDLAGPSIFELEEEEQVMLRRLVDMRLYLWD